MSVSFTLFLSRVCVQLCAHVSSTVQDIESQRIAFVDALQEEN